MSEETISKPKIGMAVKLAASAIVAGVALFTAFTTIDDRYAHADEFSQRLTNVEKSQQTVQIQIQSAVNQMREKQLEDYVFTYEFKVQTRQASPLDRALLERYKRELQTLQRGETTR